MSRKPVTIISDAARGLSAADAGLDWHDTPTHHRYYGSTAFNGGERIVERRSGIASRVPNLAGF